MWPVAIAVAAMLLGPPPGTVSERLPNGLLVTVVPVPGNPVVSTQVWYHVGSAHEAPGSRGLAHLFEHLMFGKTRTRGARDYEDYHHRHGGYENAFTTPDETVYVSEIAPPHHLGVLEMEADRMAGLVLDREDLDNERKVVTEELRLRTENDPWSRVLVAAQRALLADHPYAHDPSGTKEDVASASVESCLGFYRRYYRADNAHLVVVGPVDPGQVVSSARRFFGAVDGGGASLPEIPSLASWPFPDEIVLEEDLPPAEIAIAGFPLPPADSEDRLALEVLAELIAGGAVDPFRKEIVDRRGKALAAGVEFLFFRRGGGAVFYTASLPYRRKKTAFRIIDEALGTLSDLAWLTEESLDGARRSLLRRALAREYFARSRARAVGRARWWYGDEGAAFTDASSFAEVSLEDVRDVWERYVAQRAPVRVYVRPEHVPLWIRLFSWIYPLVRG